MEKENTKTAESIETLAISWAKRNSKESNIDVKFFLISKAQWSYNDFEYEVISHTGDTEEELYDLAVAVYKKLKIKTEAWLKEVPARLHQYRD
jgi:hypothetical protein